MFIPPALAAALGAAKSRPHGAAQLGRVVVGIPQPDPENGWAKITRSVGLASANGWFIVGFTKSNVYVCIYVYIYIYTHSHPGVDRIWEIQKKKNKTKSQMGIS